jgi:MraZ protein
VARFFGRYEHSLDIKGRIILPARLRHSFDTEAFLSQWHDGCLALWTPEVFEKQLAEMEAIQHRGPEERQAARVLAAGSVQVELDRQGRVAIPAYLREYASLESAVLVVGALDRIELWRPEQYLERVAPGETKLAEGRSPTAGAGL